MTELKFAVMALGRVSEEFQTRLLVYDGKVKACRARNEVWEALLFSAARFFQLLRGVKYKLIDMKKKKKRRLGPSSRLKILTLVSSGRETAFSFPFSPTLTVVMVILMINGNCSDLAITIAHLQVVLAIISKKILIRKL